MNSMNNIETVFSLDSFAKKNLSPLVITAIDKLNSLPLARIKKAGIWRDRDCYFLNISYPSMQAMEKVKAEQVYCDRQKAKKVALYVHIPFCTSECYYCHYYKQFGRSVEYVDRYIDALRVELEMLQKQFGHIEASSVYIGGGTPSYMSVEQIDRLFIMIKKQISISPGSEISFEVHPESGTSDKFAILAAHNVNRINIGVESFNEKLLLSENRRHTALEAIEVFERAKLAGIKNVNLDLIYGLKGQTIPVWEESLDQIARLQPASATMYYLRLKRGTPEFKLWKKDPSSFPTDDELLLMHTMNFERMEGELGYIQNPVDWYIKDSAYFHKYQDYNWRKSDETELLGIGASAYSYVNGWQYYNVNDVTLYQNSLLRGELPIWKGEYLEGEERMRKTVMLGIKMGMDRRHFKDTYGVDVVEAFSHIWERLVSLGLVEIHPNTVDLTYMGKLFADEVGQEFYSNAMKHRMAAVDPELVSTTWPQFNR